MYAILIFGDRKNVRIFEKEFLKYCKIIFLGVSCFTCNVVEVVPYFCIHLIYLCIFLLAIQTHLLFLSWHGDAVIGWNPDHFYICSPQRHQMLGGWVFNEARCGFTPP